MLNTFRSLLAWVSAELAVQATFFIDVLGCGACGPLTDVEKWSKMRLATWLKHLGNNGRYAKYLPYLKEMTGLQFTALSRTEVKDWCQAAATDAGVVAALADSASFRRLSRMVCVGGGFWGGRFCMGGG